MIALATPKTMAKVKTIRDAFYEGMENK